MSGQMALCGVCGTSEGGEERKFLEDGVPKWACERCWALMMPLQLHPGGIKNPLPRARKMAKEEDRKGEIRTQ